MNRKDVLKGIGACMAVWILSAFFFAILSIWRPDMDVIAGANGMTMMFAFCAGTAVAVEIADRRNG